MAKQVSVDAQKLGDVLELLKKYEAAFKKLQANEVEGQEDDAAAPVFQEACQMIQNFQESHPWTAPFIQDTVDSCRANGYLPND